MIFDMATLTAADVRVLDSVDAAGWVRHEPSYEVNLAAQRGLVYGYHGGQKLTSIGEQVKLALAIERGELPADHGREPAVLPDLVDCDFHGGRIEAHPDAIAEVRTVRCGGCGRMFERSPAENYAIDAKLPVVALDSSAIMTLLEGGNQIAALLDGTPVLLRLYSPEEIERVQHAAVHLVSTYDGSSDADQVARLINRQQAVSMARPAMPGGKPRNSLF
jgi:hypothetical protein